MVKAMDRADGIIVYYCDCWDSLCDIGEHYIDARCYLDREAAERHARRLSRTDDDCVSYHADVREMRLVGVKSIETY